MRSKILFYSSAVVVGLLVAVIGTSLYQDDVSELLNSIEKAKIYYFYSDYCPHCREAKPYVAKLNESYGVNYCNVQNLSKECAKLAQSLKIKYIPTLVFIADKNYVFTGSNEVIDIVNKIEGAKK